MKLSLLEYPNKYWHLHLQAQVITSLFAPTHYVSSDYVPPDDILANSYLAGLDFASQLGTASISKDYSIPDPSVVRLSIEGFARPAIQCALKNPGPASDHRGLWRSLIKEAWEPCSLNTSGALKLDKTVVTHDSSIKFFPFRLIFRVYPEKLPF